MAVYSSLVDQLHDNQPFFEIFGLAKNHTLSGHSLPPDANRERTFYHPCQPIHRWEMGEETNHWILGHGGPHIQHLLGESVSHLLVLALAS